ncbi:beta strand repeat-containing protein [Acidicapsa ligni]|uniref:beta strand repeat-containing protein n=1 Tax=Acidicapsa ligni TaxID=542300 RepID=UPI0021E09FF3|nr:putative Ig domain-containing protein [Acidicapsa ligni]
MASLFVMALCVVLAGCGGGGYAGGGITGVSASSVVLDAGQSYEVTANISEPLPVAWSLSGASCSGSTCGTLSTTTGAATTYTAPTGVTAQMKLTLLAAVNGTKSQQSVSVTVNPDPTISGTPSGGVIGSAYTATLVTAGGTGPLTLSLSNGALPPGLAFDASTGVISGTPTTLGTYTFTAKLTDSSTVPYTVKVPETITISPTNLTLTTTNLPNGTVNVPYTGTIIATGGVPPYMCAITGGTLPTGLTLNGCTVSGIPTGPGSSTVIVKVTDTANPVDTTSGPETITISPSALILTATTLPNGTVNVPYTSLIGVSGGVSPYSCAITSGTLPTGLKLTGCTVSGTPTTAGTSTVTVKATDTANPVDTTTGPETIVISPSALTLTATTLPNGTVNVPYTSLIGVSGGVSPYSCAITSGTLPAGLSLSGCTVSGTPTTAGTSTVTVKTTDSANPVDTTTGPETITISPSALTLTATTLPNGTVSVPYTSLIGVSGGVSPYMCAITSGTLPAGLSLSGCTVSGTPTTAGTSTVTVRATDSASPADTVAGPETIIIAPAPMLTISTLPNGTVQVPYSSAITASGGTSPYSCSISSGTLPAGLTLAGCTVSGTPTTAGASNVSVKVTDSASPAKATTKAETIVIAPAPLTLTSTTLPNGTVSVPYSATIGTSGGVGPYICTITSGTLPAGLTLGAGCVVSGTPTTAGTSAVTVRVTDSATPANTVAGPETIIIAPAPLTLTSTKLPNGTVSVPYSATIGTSGGVGPYICAITSGTLPAGLTLGAGCVVSGTPTTPGTSNVTVRVTDSATPANTVVGPEAIIIAPAPLILTSSTLPNGTVNVPYLSLIGVSGGVGPYSCTVTSGTLPAGLTLGAGCVVSGTPTTPGTSTVTVRVTDSATPANTVAGPETIIIAPAPLILTSSTLPNGTVGVAYSSLIGVSGGVSPYSCVITSGTLPAGLTLGAGCVVSGIPTTPGTSTVTVRVTDSATPANTVVGPETIIIAPAPLILTAATLPNGTVGVAYSSLIGVSGGVGPYSCTVISGTLPTGLTLGAGCVVSGTPTTAGTSAVTVRVTDSATPANTVVGPETIIIAPAPLILTSGTLPNGTVNVPYSSIIGVSGGVSPYSCSIASGTLPNGLILNNCTVTGTPTIAGTSTIIVNVSDSAAPADKTSGQETILINPAPLVLTNSTLPNGTVGVPYTTIIGVNGGVSPYMCAVTSGTLPAGLSLTGCTVSGTPTTAGPSTVTVKVTDSASPADTLSGPETITINPAPVLVISTLPNGTVGVVYSATIGASGGISPYSCSITSGTLPTGLSLTGCIVSGTPITAGPSTVTVKVTDSSKPAISFIGSETITIEPAAALSLTATLPGATQNTPYTYQFQATGGTPQYSYTQPMGALPPGITLTSTGLLSGTPTQVGAYSFSVTVTDNSLPQQTVTVPLILLVSYPSSPNNGELKGPYAYLFQGYDDVVAGVLAYQTASVGSFTADGMGGISAGEIDQNHQSSTPAGTTISSEPFLGTYEIDANNDNRGLVTITTLKPDGTVDQTITYAISLKAPVAPATASPEGSLIEYDDNQLVGTRGSGSLLAQVPSAFPNGLVGNYAFGLSGDTPCLISCTVGIATGPVATVGQFTADTGNITSGMADANIASANFSSAQLNGTYEPADTNGRVQMTLINGGINDGLYPADYAVYMVNANEAFVMSTDKHSAYSLLAGTAQQQTQSTFSNASMDGPFVGYENAQTDPGLVGQVLQSVLNFSSATVFRAVGDGAGNCDTTNVDSGGLTALVNSLTGIGNKDLLLEALLGTTSTTGETTCNGVSSIGRGELQYPTPPSLISALLGLLGLPTGAPPPRVFYLVSPNQGYFLETGYAGLGQFEAQTGGPFTLSSVSGNYVEGSIPASSLASINSTGYLTADGAGNINSTYAENIGVGTINVLQITTSTPETYSLSDPTPDSTTTAADAGRYALSDGTTIIYAISPNRFVFIDTNPLTTSPGISLAY